MFNTRSIATLGFLTFLLPAMGQQYQSAGFLAPLEIPAVISGSFGELRANHFHSGVDFATNGRTGCKVVAAADGYVSRVKVSPVGYGKAVYVTHPNGYTSVYGHLDRYAAKIDSFVLAKQYEQENFAIDVYPSNNELRVKAGQVIGYSGNSGSSGGPHLHFEVRETASEKAYNPFLFRRDAVDKSKPVINGIRLYPVGVSSRVSGKNNPVYYKVVSVNGAYKVEGDPVVSASGRLGVGIETVDFMTGSMRRCGIYSISLRVDNMEVFRCELDAISFDESRYINSYVDYAFKQSQNKWVQKSFVDPNNQLSIYRKKENNGLVVIDEGDIHLFRYEVKDSYGNLSVLEFKVKGVQAPAADASEAAPANLLLYKQLNRLSDNGINVTIPQNCFYSNVDFSFKKMGDGQFSSVWRIGDRTVPLHLPVGVSVVVPEKYKKVRNMMALARKDASGKLHYAGGTLVDGSISANIRETGDYTLVLDTVSPSVAIKNAVAKNNYRGRNALELSVIDNFSGIAGYRCLIDDRWALFEYDAKTNRLTCPLNRIPIKKNQMHALRVEITDGCGNTTIKNYQFGY